MAVSNQDILNFLATNPTDAQLASAMETYGVSPSQIAAALAEDVSKNGTQTQTIANAETGQIDVNQRDLGAGFSAYQDESGGLTFSRVDPTNKDYLQYYDANGNYVGREKIKSTAQSIWSDLGPIALAAGGSYLAQSGLLGNLLGGDAASLAADADIAGGLIPEFGTNAAYNSFMTGAMTPEALAALDALVTANPEIIGSGALLTDAAAGLTPAVTPTTPIVTPTATTPAVTPTTPVTPPVVPPVTPTVTPTVTPAVTSLLPTLTPSVISALTGLLGSTVLNKALTPSTTTPAKVSIPTQGVPLNSEDYFKAIQQNYNSLMPVVPRDVASPLAAWYNSQYGA